MIKVVVFWGEEGGHTFVGELFTHVKEGRLIITSKDQTIRSEFAPGHWDRYISAKLSDEEVAKIRAAAEQKEAVVE